jgi:bacteriorhodopsin
MYIMADNINDSLEVSFYITFVFLTTTATITIIEALRTNVPAVRHIMNLETAISVIAAFFYNKFITKIDEYKSNAHIDWKEFTLLRYIDWSITTPFMLLSLCLFLGTNTKIPLHSYVIIPVWILNYIMLYLGYLGEVGTITQAAACISGFIPLFLVIFIIYKTFIENQKSTANTILFSIFGIIWSCYGLVYLLPEKQKNITMNVLDLIAKCLVGLGMWMYYVKIVK